jgi:antitoxin FitA
VRPLDLACGSVLLHVPHMPKMVQIRNVPEALHRRLAARAAMAGMTLSDYLRGELEQIAAQLTYEELRNRLGELPAAKVAESPADAVRAERDSR